MSSMSSTADDLAAALVTLEDLRRLVSAPDRRRQVAQDSLTIQFLRERATAPEISAQTGLSADYLAWLFETLISSGDRIGADVVLPNFRLLPAERTESWPRIYARSFAPYSHQGSSADGSRAAAYSGAESLIAWRVDSSRSTRQGATRQDASRRTGGYYTPHGWVYPRFTQHIESR